MPPRKRTRTMAVSPEPCKDAELFYTLMVFQVHIHMGQLGGCVILFTPQVEDTLFKVPQAPFVRESEVFRDMFDLPVPEDAESDGTSEAHPLRLDGIQLNTFRPFLKAMYAP